MEFTRPLISAARLSELLADGDVAVLDCRFGPASDPDAGRRAYFEGHIPGALYLHLDEDLSGPAREHGGRHPLPDPAVIGAKLGAAGIGPGVKVVAYDDSGPYAARCWWVLRWLGHDDVAVLDGGYKAWLEVGLPVATEVPAPTPHTFEPRPRPEMVASMEAVLHGAPDITVVDARSAQRYAGQADPLDPKQGHIPGAVNRFWAEGLDSNGRWRAPQEQAARFESLPEGPSVVHSCGSGVTACANLLAMEIAGVKGGRLYVGSWSDWCSWPDNPIARE